MLVPELVERTRAMSLKARIVDLGNSPLVVVSTLPPSEDSIDVYPPVRSLAYEPIRELPCCVSWHAAGPYDAKDEGSGDNESLTKREVPNSVPAR